ncbi:MAG TPA: DinB family protein [Vicinamibacterales bacterium]|nr:DinB family protein [Vicinamibacterales bacterium]
MSVFRRFSALAALAAFAAVASPAPARAQDVINKDAAAALKASFTADLDGMQKKFVALAEAFPQDKYTWRPMEGVRSVSEVLMLAAMEGYSFIPTGFGGKAADLGSREDAQKLRTLTDKAQVIEHLNKGFAHAKAQLASIDPATLTGKHKMMGRDLSAIDTALFIGGDLHEHLGQLIAYARMNKIVPPWSK